MDADQIAGLIQTFGLSGVFIFLYVRERMINVERTNAHIADLREIAGLRQNLRNTQYYVEQSKQFPREPEMRDFEANQKATVD